MSAYTEKRILIITTGGTISGNVAESIVSSKVHTDISSFEAIIANAIAVIEDVWNIEVKPDVKDLLNIDSSDFLPEHWTLLAKTIQEAYDDYDAFIVLHGTNTMGYTAAALSFAFENINKPIILTGAQVPLGYLGSDAVTNLVNSLRLAIWTYHQIKGVIAVFGSKIISGVRVKKGTDFDYDPFKSFITGSLGQIGRVIRIEEAALEKHVMYLSKSSALAHNSGNLVVKRDFDASHIASLTEFPGMEASIFEHLVETQGTKAFILRAFGAGDPNKALFPAFEFLKKKHIPIIVTTQAPNGVASFQVNENGQRLKKEDLAIPAFDMSIEAMTTKLAWLLAQKMSYEQIKMHMLQDLHGEINIENDLI
ncbi:MAG TPA: asparaginase [Candidatus Saccharimonadales bacterium]|nr:asparaginase [Candidatus Saccharimonadales bacterium]